MSRYLLSLCLLGVTLALASCGGSSNSTSPATTAPTGGGQGESLSKAQFIAQADDVCKKIKEEDAVLESRFSKLSETASNEAEVKEVADLVRKLTAYTVSGVTQLKELEPPAADANEIDAFFEAIGDRVSAAKAYAKALEEADKASTESLTKEATAASEKASGIAKSYGFKVCGARK